jgi:hypothetical protein
VTVHKTSKIRGCHIQAFVTRGGLTCANLPHTAGEGSENNRLRDVNPEPRIGARSRDEPPFGIVRPHQREEHQLDTASQAEALLAAMRVVWGLSTRGTAIPAGLRRCHLLGMLFLQPS